MIKSWKQETENPTVKTLFYEWINRKLEYQDICRGTFNRYETDYIKFFENHSEFGDKRVRQIKSNNIVFFLRKAIVQYSFTAKSYSNLGTFTYGIFKYVKEKEYISWSVSQTTNDMELP